MDKNILAKRWNLTEREADIVMLVARACDNTTIAARLGISEATVKVIMQHVTSKFGRKGGSSRVAVAILALGGEID